MMTFRLIVLIFTLSLAALLLPAPGFVLAEDILPDGCLGNLNENQVIVYYFHRKFRCEPCQTLESTLQETLKTSYNDYFGAGMLAMCVVNVDEPENSHYLEQFEILSNTVIVVEKRDGDVSRFESVEEVWDVSEDREAISRLLRKAVDEFLKGS